MRAWSAAAEEKLRSLYATTPLPRLAFLLKRTETAVRSRAKVLGLSRGTRRPWTKAEDRELSRRYPTEAASGIAADMKRGVSAVYQRADFLGLEKPADWASRCARDRWAQGRHENSRRAHFAPGQVPANKGLRRPGWSPGRMATTQFKKGRAASEARNYVPIGTEKFDAKRGVLVRKITDDPSLLPANRWRPVHVLVWSAVHGDVPAGHIVRFRDGMKTLVASEITEDRLELVTLAENMRRNTVHRYPKEVVQLVQLRGALNRKINRRSKQA